MAVRYRPPCCCTECWTAPACVCWHTTLKLVCTSLHFPHGFQILSFFSSCTNRVLDSSTSCVFRTECTGVQHARTHAHTHRAHSTCTHTTHISLTHSHLFLFYLPLLPSSARTTAVQFLNTLCFPCRFDSDADASSREQQTPSCWESSSRRRGRRRKE